MPWWFAVADATTSSRTRPASRRSVSSASARAWRPRRASWTSPAGRRDPPSCSRASSVAGSPASNAHPSSLARDRGMGGRASRRSGRSDVPGAQRPPPWPV